jgi:hypothetical protein
MAGKDKVLFVRCDEELQSALKEEWEHGGIHLEGQTSRVSFSEFLRRILQRHVTRRAE